MVFAADQVVTNNSNSGAGSLRQALADVGSGGTITFNLTAGNEVITISAEMAVSKAMTIDGANSAGSGTPVTIQVTTPGSSSFRVFSVNAGGGIVTMQNMTLKGGNLGVLVGGAIFVAGTTLNLNSLTITGSVGHQAGGVYVYSCTCNMTNCILSNCSTNNTGTESHGGFTYALGATVTLTSCTITGNSSNAGGAFFNGAGGGNLTITNCTFSNNTGTAGGAIYNEGTTKIYNSTINSNTSSYDGGAIMSYGALYLVSSTLAGNSCGRTGGVIYTGGTNYLVNATISGNSASAGGGGIFQGNGNTYVLNSIIINNSAASGADFKINAGGAYCYNSWYNGVAGTITTQAAAPNVTTAYVTGNLGTLSNNGGTTKTMAIAAAAPGAGSGTYSYFNATDGYYFIDNQSPAVSHRLNAWGTHPTVANNDKITLDQRGTTISSLPSMGAYDEAFSATWTGGSDSDWNNASNWSSLAVPVAIVDVTIPSVPNLPVVTSQPASPAGCKNLAISSGASLTIAPGRALSVNGTLTNSAGNTGIVIQSDATGTGSLIQNSSGIDATVSRYLTGNNSLTTNTYHFVSIPVNYNNPTSALFMGSYLYRLDATQTEPTNSNYYGKWINQGSSTTIPLEMNTGYMVYYPGASHTYIFTGTLRTGSISAAVSYGGNYTFNLVPNPYPSAINWGASSGWTKNGIGGVAWIWSAVNGTYTALSGTSYIPQGQAFIVMTHSASPVLSMDNSVCVHSSTSFYKEGVSLSNRLTLSAAFNTYYDDTLVTFDEAATSGFDPELDGFKLDGLAEAPCLYTRNGEFRFCINALPGPVSSVMVPVEFATSLSGTVTLEVHGTESFDPGLPIRLRDNATSQMIDLRKQPSYTFTHDPANKKERFTLIFGYPDGLPETTLDHSLFWISQGKIYADLSEVASADHPSGCLLEVFNLYGQPILSRKIETGHITTITHNLQGMVIARLTVNDKVYTIKGITGQ